MSHFKHAPRNCLFQDNRELCWQWADTRNVRVFKNRDSRSAISCAQLVNTYAHYLT